MPSATARNSVISVDSRRVYRSGCVGAYLYAVCGVIVVGVVNSHIDCSLVAKKRSIEVDHIEAGL